MITAGQVARWGRFELPTGDELELLELVIAAAVAHLYRYYVVDEPATPTQRVAVIMQTARLWKRRDTPEGRDAFGGEIAVTVTSFDADVDAMLQPRPAVA